jgi:glycosyltransferase involved in cell wall biosynthesis
MENNLADTAGITNAQKEMHVGVICPQYPPAASEGGISHYTHLLVRELYARGFAVTVFTGNDHLGGAAPETVVTLPEPWDRHTTDAITREMKKRSVQLLNLQYSPAGYSWRFKSALPRLLSSTPSVVSFHTLWGGRWRDVLTAFVLWLYARRIIATNSEIVYLLKKWMPFCLGKTRFIPIGSNIVEAPVDHERFHRLMRRYGLDNDTPVFIYFGMMYGGKGLSVLLKTAEVLARNASFDFRLLMVGGGLDDTALQIEKIKRELSSLGCRSKIIITGKIPDTEVSYLFGRSQIAVFPFESGASDRRGSLLAAIAHGKAIVTTRPCIPIKSFINGETMTWAEHLSAETLAGLILKVHKDAELRRRLESGSRRIASNFLWNNIASQTAKAFEETAVRTAIE